MGADMQTLAMSGMFCFIALLGLSAARAGRRSGYFVLAGYGVVGATYGAYAVSTIVANATALAWTYLLQLGGRAFEGLALFWALVDRLNDTMLARTVAEQRASTDALTGLPNRRTFDSVIEREWKRARRAGTWLAVGMIDIDHFKRYNDEHGHRAGDDCLRRVAQAIANELNRQDDVAARYGGEEFAIVLPATDSDGAEQIAVRICERIRRTQDVTVSIGISACLSGERTADDLIEHADRALYRAKSEGRNRVASAEALAEFA
ncbi:MAG: diguanylate cyclase [Candidatus Eremiobacteraeota bacterium]|nr:diguanylate cyclase [Candidatus Eremiobacteraeota bacterium]